MREDWRGSSNVRHFKLPRNVSDNNNRGLRHNFQQKTTIPLNSMFRPLIELRILLTNIDTTLLLFMKIRWSIQTISVHEIYILVTCLLENIVTLIVGRIYLLSCLA